MNLIHFIDAVKEKLDTMSEQDKSDFIVKYAETLPESVYCKIEMQEVAIEKCRLLHIQNAGNCKNCGE